MTATIRARVCNANNTPTVPAVFWERFVSLSQDKSLPVVMGQDVLSEPLMNLEDVFELARNVVESGDMTVNADGQMLKQPAVPGFPQAFDGFEQFVRDFAALNNAEGITFTRDYCLKHSSTVATRLRAFTHGYIERYGMPYPGANAVFIGGRYRSTWIGLHNDSCDTFLFPLYGRKRMMIWPPAYFDEMALEKKSALNGVCFGHIDVSPYVGDATIYEVEAGEIFFIPAGWWHYNKLEALETTLTVSVGMFSHGTAQGFCENPIKAAIASSAGSAQTGAIPPVPGGVFDSLADVELPVQVARFVDTIRDNSKIQMLLKLSANGIIRDRAVGRSAVVDWSQARFQARADSPLYLLALNEQAGLLFAAGAMLRVQELSAVRDLIGVLQGAGPVRVQDDGDEVQNVVRWLYEQAAIDTFA
ncbi:cupin-like domain-containing protein [Pseudomonas extremorientalis]|uniref:cupin-like domain-containing protein n=1 Tax=Pseudomonas extremorientalis TaxID=169669 RepID=UPI0027357623|nr:cupin-like domain-containing protein [Pseudomonas extremorientalis]WLG55684.1 cupin-like domain-containing protein [Pseudomonas extremorientalis]